MRCERCGTENPDDARYCRACGEKMEEENPLKRFEGYNFKPVRMVKWKTGEAMGKFFLLLLCFLFSVLGVIVTIETSEWGGIFITGIMAFISGIGLRWFFRRAFTWRAQLEKCADYVQDLEEDEYVFILKNDKVGVFSTKRCKVQLPAVYDWLAWTKFGETLYATQNGQRFLMNIYGLKE